ncbi:MAG: hypothetical protein F6J94_23730 [Moorea sp. SIO1F2]|nr:hypothetical protein [Moorena sp. SIO1F2]NET84815.1 hypothetical protein [Moorena sp. SIO1F2]
MATLREQPDNLGLWPRYANNLITLAFGHATRTTFNLQQLTHKLYLS